jgi:antitoxin component of MazEF toxin-antitoxin module
MEGICFQGTGEVIRDGNNYLLVFSKDLADKAGLQEGDKVAITVEEGIKIKLTKFQKE